MRGRTWRYLGWILLASLVLLGLLSYYRGALHKTSDPLYDRIASMVHRQSSRIQRRPLLARIGNAFGIESWYSAPYDLNFSEMETWQPSGNEERLIEARGLLIPFSSTAYDYLRTSGDVDYNTPLFTLAFKRFYEEDEDAALAAASKLVERDPENATNHYLKAFLLINLGEIEAAHESIRLGNDAPRCMYPLPYPADLIAKGQVPMTSLADRQVAGVIWAHVCFSRLVGFKAKEAWKNTELCIKLGYPLDFADDFLLMIKRIGQSEDIPVTEQWSMYSIAHSLIKIVATDIVSLTPDQRADYDALLAELEQIPSLMQSRLNPSAKYFEGELMQFPGSNYSYPEMIRISLSMDGFRGIKRQDFVKVGSVLTMELETSKEAAKLFDCLNPPPFELWAQGSVRSGSSDR